MAATHGIQRTTGVNAISIIYQTTLENVTPADLAGGFFVGWPNPLSPERHLAILQGSSHIVLARRESPHGGSQVVGFINAISDGVLTAYIPLLEVLPGWQGQGIGSELVRRMLGQLDSLYAIDLLCDPELQPFYARFGLHPASGMLKRNYARQSGA